MCKHAVLRSSAAYVGLLVADEDVKRLLALRDRENTLLYCVYRLCLGFIYVFLIAVGILDSRAIVLVGVYRGVLRSIDRGDLLVAYRIFDVYYAVAAEHDRPVRLSVGIVLVKYLLVDGERLVVFIVSAQMVCSVVEISALIVGELGKGLRGSAEFAFCYRCVAVYFKRTTAHFTFKNSHYLLRMIFI